MRIDRLKKTTRSDKKLAASFFVVVYRLDILL